MVGRCCRVHIESTPCLLVTGDVTARSAATINAVQQTHALQQACPLQCSRRMCCSSLLPPARLSVPWTGCQTAPCGLCSRTGSSWHTRPAGNRKGCTNQCLLTHPATTTTLLAECSDREQAWQLSNTCMHTYSDVALICNTQLSSNTTHLAGHTECDVSAYAPPVQHRDQDCFDAATCGIRSQPPHTTTAAGA
jgi:hypothetical protein